MPNIHNAIIQASLEIKAGGPGSGRKPTGTFKAKPAGRYDVLPRNKYDERRTAQVVSLLKSAGFKFGGGNEDITKGPVIYTTKNYTASGTPEDTTNEEHGQGYEGHVQHTVMLYQNGEWEHVSEGSHSGYGTEGLQVAMSASADIQVKRSK